MANFDGGTLARRNPWHGKHSALAAAWDYSARQLSSLVESGKTEGVMTLGLAGSYARMEAGPAGDLDLVILVDDPLPDDLAQEVDERVRRSARDQGFHLPQSHGIFARPVREAELFAPVIGQIDESPRTFGLRIQWLLEMQPLQGAREFQRIQRRIVERYATDFVTAGPEKQWIYLLNDTIRYFRSLFLKYQWESRDNPARWELRNLKGRHSRTVLYAGLLFLLGESGIRKADKVEWLLNSLQLTPLERIAAIYQQYADNNLITVLNSYGEFVAWSGAEASRKTLGTAGMGRRSAEYLHWKQNADLLQQELIRFTLDRRSDWSPRFFQRLFF
ncbi:MAG: hypothetical protein U0903_06990 [Planctomycetales bacterium]